MIAELSSIIDRCQNSNIGKLLPTALYVHVTALPSIDRGLQLYETQARDIALQHYRDRRGIEAIQSLKPFEDLTLVKFNTAKPQISYLFYRNFDSDPHPKLQKSILVNLATQQVTKREYQRADNPPILHRKETFVTADYPHHQQFAQLTQEEEISGLLDNPRFIGNHKQWQQLLSHHKLDIVEHHLICPINPQYGEPEFVEIDRHRAALHRKELSRPLKLALEAEIFQPESSFFDYGCGHGRDIIEIGDRGYASKGWDPHYASDTPLEQADVVNIGYVVNVIENLQERREALIKAWELTNRVLIVSAQVLIDDRQRGLVAYADGVITKRNTFQKYYEQEELKAYIDSILNVDAVPVALGVFFVFRNYGEAETFRASRFVSRVAAPRVYRDNRSFADYREMLLPLMNFYTQRGRLPAKGELPEEETIKAEFKTYRRAFKLVLQVTDKADWEAISNKRRQDLLVYLALANFKGRPSIRKVAREIKADAKGLLEGYQQACTIADLLLVSVRDLKKIEYLCRNSPVGKQLTGAIAIHVSALNELPALLRVYEGCASRVYGRLQDANIIKLYYDRPKVSYLHYPDFDTQAHPTLQTTMEVDLSNYSVLYNDLSEHPNPLVLHHKDALVSPSYNRYREFQQLVSLESQLGLLSDRSLIRRQQEWQQHLQQHHLEIQDHNLACAFSCMVRS